MRGGDERSGELFSYVDLEARVRRDHPLRTIRTIVNEALTGLEREFADWAISTKRWELPAAAIRRRCADDIAAAMREEYMTDKKGRRVRVLHPAPFASEGQTEMVWDDIR